MALRKILVKILVKILAEIPALHNQRKLRHGGSRGASLGAWPVLMEGR